MKRTFAIGDLHGCLTALHALAEIIDFQQDDEVITLGDYVDRGPDSKGVIDFLLALGERCQLVSLRGNHEVMMQEATNSRQELLGWLSVGGDATLLSYGTSFLDVPEKHWDFIQTLRAYYETDTHFFVHANAAPDVPLASQTDDALYWEPFIKPSAHVSGKVMVCGHTSQRSGLPKNLGHAICIDTWVYGDGWLTCLEVNSGRYWQSNQRGETRMGLIEDCRE